MNALSPSDLPLSHADWAALRDARRRMERPGFAARVSAIVGAPMQRAFALAPAEWRSRLMLASHVALEQAARAAMASLDPVAARPARTRTHVAAGAVLGAAGGFFGPLGLIVELPASTLLMLRAIADIARAEGEDLSGMEARFACLQVFALGGRTPADDAANTGYYGVRTAVSLASSDLTKRALSGAVPLARLLSERFGVVVSQKAAAQMAPIIGAATGAAINAAFVDHFQSMARGHFAIRRLERHYGAASIQRAYETLAREF